MVHIKKHYRHYKNRKEYRVIAIGKMESTQEQMVVYTSVTDEGETWIRPVTEFEEIVDHCGKKVFRFSPVSDLMGLSSILGEK